MSDNSLPAEPDEANSGVFAISKREKPPPDAVTNSGKESIPDALISPLPLWFNRLRPPEI